MTHIMGLMPLTSFNETSKGSRRARHASFFAQLVFIRLVASLGTLAAAEPREVAASPGDAQFWRLRGTPSSPPEVNYCSGLTRT